MDALAVPGPPQQLILGHLSLQERTHLAASCKELFEACFGWTWEVPVVIDWCHTPVEAIGAWLQRRPGCELSVRFVEVFTPLPDALSPLPVNLITELRTFRVPDCQRLSSTATRLQRLHIDEVYFAAELTALRLLTQLHELGISGVRQDVLFEALPALSTMPLRHLSTHECTEAGLAALLPAVRALTSLECHFDSPRQPNPMCQQQLQLLTQLQSLQLDCSWLTAVPASLPPTLTSLAVRFQQVPLMQLHRLARLHQLRSLALVGGIYPHGGMYALHEELPPLPQLAELDLSYCVLRAVPATVAALTALTILQLNVNRIQSGWEHLAPLSHLQVLAIAQHIIPGWEEDTGHYLHAILAAFSRLTSLTLLSLAGQHYIRGSWRHLKPLMQLQRLDLSRAQLPRMLRGLTALYGLPLRIEVGEDDVSHHWDQRFNECNARLLQQHQHQQERTTAQPVAQQQPRWALRLLRRLAGGCACTAATE